MADNLYPGKDVMEHQRLSPELRRQLAIIKRLCQHWGAPNLTHITIIARDPEDDSASLVVTHERDITDACRVAIQEH